MGPLVNDLNQSVNRSHHTFFIGGNIMKKILSFVLVLAMVLGSVAMVFATEYPDVTDDADCAEAVNVLSAVGVIEGYNDGTFKPEKTITRAEAIKIVVAALGLPVTEGNSYPTQFTDVPATAWYSGYVRYGVALKITEGTTPTTFRPDQTVTYDQMITFIMRALGYDDRLVGGYPAGYIMRAYQEGVLDADMTTGNVGAPRGDIAQMLYNALNKRFVAYDKNTDTFVAATPYGNNKPTMYALLGNFAEPDTTKTVVTYATIEASKLVDLSEYLGAQVNFVRKGTAADPGDIVGINTVFTEFVEGYDADTKKIGDYAQKSPAATTSAAVRFTNGATAGTFNLADGGKFAVIVKDGKVDEVISQQIWDVKKGGSAFLAAENVQDEIDLANNTKNHALNGAKFAVDDETKAIKDGSYILEGVKSLADIAKNNVVYVYTDGSTITKVQVGQEIVTGKISAISSDGKKVTVGGTQYSKAANSTTDLTDADLRGADAVDLYLDVDGKVFDAKVAQSGDTSSTVYGIVLNGATIQNAGTIKEEPAIIRVFTQDGKSVDYTMKKLDYTGAYAAAGKLVALTIEDEKVTSVTAIQAAPVKGTNDTDISAKGLVGSDTLGASAIVFGFDGKDATKASSYSIISAEKIYGQKALPITYIASKGSIKAAQILSAGISTKAENKVVVTGWGYGEGTDYSLNVMENGASKSYTATKDVDTSKITKITTGAAAVSVLDFDSNGKVNAITETLAAATDTIDLTGTAYANRTTLENSNGILKITAAKKYNLADTVTVYTKDGSSWSGSTNVNSLANLYESNAKTLFVFKNADGLVDVAIIVK